MKKKLIIIIALIAIIALVAYKFIYKEHRDISTEEAEFSIAASELKAEFVKSDSIANAKYADKTIVVTGILTAIDTAAHSITVDNQLSATLKENATGLKLQQQVRVKGRFVGYDDILEELKMDQGSIQK